jgi:hypothetical protein
MSKAAQPFPTCADPPGIERPRFFSGQFLTDQDLEAAQHYVIEKNRLHNRYLVGQGVVCGMTVRCAPCSTEAVVIEPGYAIDCCGYDIVICEETQFNVIEHLEACRHQEAPNCVERISRSSFCEKEETKHCLVIYYDEEHIRPVSAMTRRNGCNVDRCEPSRTREIFRFGLIPADEIEGLNPQLSMWDQLSKCTSEVFPRMAEFVAEISEAQSNINDGNLDNFHATIVSIYCRMRDYVIELYRNGPNNRCSIVDDLAEYDEKLKSVSPSPQNQKYLSIVYEALFGVFVYIIQFIIDCICDAFLVRCAPCKDNAVLLACLTLKERKIIHICNIVRTQVLTGPAFRYWLQPVFEGLDQILSFLCCEFSMLDLLDSYFQPRKRGFSTVDDTLRTADVGLKSAAAFATTARRGFNISRVMEVVRPGTVSVMEVVGKDATLAKKLIEKTGAEVEIETAPTDNEAYNLKNFARMSWTVPPSARKVKITVAPDGRVTAMRVMKE